MIIKLKDNITKMPIRECIVAETGFGTSYLIKNGIGYVTATEDIIENLVNNIKYISPCSYFITNNDYFVFSNYYEVKGYNYNKLKDTLVIYCESITPYNAKVNFITPKIKMTNKVIGTSGTEITNNDYNLSYFEEIKGKIVIFYKSPYVRGGILYKDDKEISYIRPASNSAYYFNNVSRLFSRTVENEQYINSIVVDTEETPDVKQFVQLNLLRNNTIDKNFYIINFDFNVQEWQNNIAFVRRLHNAHELKERS